jgi:hypothetical protein
VRGEIDAFVRRGYLDHSASLKDTLGHLKPRVPLPEIAFKRGGAWSPNGAPNGKALSAEILADFHAHYLAAGKGIFDLVLQKYPVQYFQSLVKLAHVLKVEIGQPGGFQPPETETDVLQRLEDRAGPKARKLFEDYLRSLQAESEAKLIEHDGN